MYDVDLLVKVRQALAKGIEVSGCKGFELGLLGFGIGIQVGLGFRVEGLWVRDSRVVEVWSLGIGI